MRKQFADTIKTLAIADKSIVFLTGDLGFMALEGLRDAIGDRFINCGVAEQNMVSMAAGMASRGLKPICYSIVPFVTHRVAEQLKIDVCLHNMNVKIVGNGGGYGYGVMGPTHHAIEDIALMSSLQNMKCYVPWCNEETPQVVEHMMNTPGPAYLRLGLGTFLAQFLGYSPIRKIANGSKATIIGMGPVVLNALDLGCDVFAVNEIPCIDSRDIDASIRTTGKVIFLEEHVKRGGMGEYMLANHIDLARLDTRCFLYAKGYPSGLYGSQEYHQKESGLDRKSIEEVVNGI
jgi:transketolase